MIVDCRCHAGKGGGLTESFGYLGPQLECHLRRAAKAGLDHFVPNPNILSKPPEFGISTYRIKRSSKWSCSICDFLSFTASISFVGNSRQVRAAEEIPLTERYESSTMVLRNVARRLLLAGLEVDVAPGRVQCELAQ